MVQLERLLSEKTSDVEYFEKPCRELVRKIERSVHVSRMKQPSRAAIK